MGWIKKYDLKQKHFYESGFLQMLRHPSQVFSISSSSQYVQILRDGLPTQLQMQLALLNQARPSKRSIDPLWQQAQRQTNQRKGVAFKHVPARRTAFDNGTQMQPLRGIGVAANAGLCGRKCNFRFEIRERAFAYICSKG